MPGTVAAKDVPLRQTLCIKETKAHGESKIKLPEFYEDINIGSHF